MIFHNSNIAANLEIFLSPATLLRTRNLTKPIYRILIIYRLIINGNTLVSPADVKIFSR